MKVQTVTVVIPNNLEFVSLITNVAGNLAKQMGFSENEIQHIEIASEEAVSRIIKFAFDEGEDTTVDVDFNIKKLGLEIVIRDKGMPFDPTVVPEYSPEKFKEDLSEDGLGIYLMKKFMDVLHFHNLGKEGKKTCLFKYLSNSKVEELLSREELEDAKQEREASTLPKGSARYTVRRMKPEEAVEVSRCAYTSYGYTYVHEDVYYPERLRTLNEDEDVISFVCVTDDGEIMAHAALEREKDRMVPQLGIAATKPKFRAQGCLGALNNALIDEAIKRKFTGLYARGITTHIFSQKSISKMGMVSCGILISSGKEREYKGIEQGKIQRESVVVMLKYLNKPLDQVIFLPEKHAQIIQDIYTNLDHMPMIAEADPTIKLPEEASKIIVNPNNASLTADIYVHAYDKDIMHHVQDKLKILCQHRYETIYLHLKLKDPFTALYTNRFERMGFFFAGVMPHSENNDVLILQYLNNHVIDYNYVNVADAFAEKLKAYIMDNDINLTY